MKFLKFLVKKTGNNEKEQNMAFIEITSINYDCLFKKVNMKDKKFQMIIDILNQASQFQILNSVKKEILMKLKNKVIEKRNKDIFFNKYYNL